MLTYETDRLRAFSIDKWCWSPIVGLVAVYSLYRLYFWGADIHGLAVGITVDLNAPESEAALINLRPVLGRLSWAVTGTFFGLSVLSAVALLGWSIRDGLEGKVPKRVQRIVAGVVIVAILVVGSALWNDNPFTVARFNSIVDRTFSRYGFTGASTLMDMFVPAVICVTILLTANSWTALVLATSQNENLDSAHRITVLRQQFRRLNTALFVGAIVIVAGIVHASIIHRLPGVSLTELRAEKLDEFVHGLSASMGAIWTLLLFGIYVPSHWVLRTEALRVADGRDDKKTGNDKWLADHGLTWKLSEKLTQVGALLSPLLIGGPAAPLIRLLTG